MFRVARERTFSASHQLREYQGKCERLHGHNWRVRVMVEAEELDEKGMVIDFHDLDRIMGQAIEPFEHRHLNDVPPFDSVNPSAENMARIILERVADLLENDRARVVRCDVFENDLSRASYYL